MDLSQITPLILTFNESPNIGRCLERLRWAREVVVLDSFSTDDTLEIAAKFDNVRIEQREFTDHTEQWNHGLSACGISTPWVLSLDADYLVSPSLPDELKQLDTADFAAFEAEFRYCIGGKPLSGSAYGPVAVLFRRDQCRYVPDGHTQRLKVMLGRTGKLHSKIDHDDRKPLDRWFRSQISYAALEAQKLQTTPHESLGFADRLRKRIVFAPGLVFAYTLLIKGGLLNGRAGWFYAFQRLVAESMLSLKLLERR